VGQLRQSSNPEAGKSYWMAFSNKGRPVKRGDHVIVEIGTFKAEGLVVINRSVADVFARVQATV
jgi:hypothetical protein